MKQHGIGVGYRYPHDFEGADVDQQYLPDELVGRRYYLPDRPGLRGDDRGADGRPGPRPARRRGPPAAPQDPFPTPEMARGAGENMLRTREENRKKLAETEKRDAGDGTAAAAAEPIERERRGADKG